MKYAQLIVGLVAGIAVGGAVAIATKMQSGSPDKDAVQKIVRDVISQEPKLILESVQKFQMSQRDQEMAQASAKVGQLLKDEKFKKDLFDYADMASVGPKDSKKVIVEFFDYDCPACKMQFKAIDDIVKKDKDVRVIFREFPIFGPPSELNSKIGIAVNRLYPDKYFLFHEKMMDGPGHSASEAKTTTILKEMGLDVAKVKAEAAKPDVQATLDATRDLAQKLDIRGTPSLIVGEEFIPHAAGYDELMAKLNKAK